MFLYETKPTWAPDKQAKMIMLKDSFSRSKISDSAQANTARNQTLHRLTLNTSEKLGLTYRFFEKISEIQN